MKTIILFPADFYDENSVDAKYKGEYDTVLSFPEFTPVIFNYDKFLEGGELELIPDMMNADLCIYRGWMLNDSNYNRLYNELAGKNIKLVNTPEQYCICHMFPKVYSYIKSDTPEAIWFDKNSKIELDLIKSKFERFMIKDYVKSVKESSFPRFFTKEISEDELSKYVEEFIRLRSKRFTGGLVFKEYVDLRQYDGKTNEYRVFYFKSKIVSVSRNSNQPDFCPFVDETLVNKYSGLKSNFYTVDFAEVGNGKWIVIETGDGQVSGLSPNQFIFKFYEELCLCISNN